MKSWEKLRECTEFSSVPEWVPEGAVKTFSEGMGNYIIGGCHGFWFEPGNSEGHSDLEILAVTIGRQINSLTQIYNSHTTQSPIEDMLLGALLWIDKDWGGLPECCLMDSPAEAMQHMGERDQIDFWIVSQGKVGPYRTDFLLWFSYKKLVAGVAVECDGHAFHEKTKEQAARDKKRDREILKAGFPVIRFSGSEIYKSPGGCAQQVADLLSDALDRVSRAAGLYA